MPVYDIRVTCDEGGGSWHYIYEEEQDPLDLTVDCPTHPGSTMRDFVIVKMTLDE